MLTDEELAAVLALVRGLDDDRQHDIIVRDRILGLSRTAHSALTKLLARERRLSADEFLDQLALTIATSAQTVLARRSSTIGPSLTAAAGPEGVATAFARGVSLDTVRTAIAAPFAAEIGNNAAQCVNEFLISGQQPID
jgi:hypothetical protein